MSDEPTMTEEQVQLLLDDVSRIRVALEELVKLLRERETRP